MASRYAAPAVNSAYPRAGLWAGFALLALTILTALSSPVGAAVYDAETFTLDNGMQVVVVTNRRVPVVTHMVWYRVGAADEPHGKSGIAHFLEHLMFKGTDEIEEGEFSKIIARNGGRDNAFTSWDFTAYFQSIARDRLEMVMRMEADRMADLQLTPEAVATERDVVLEERRQRTENNPADRFREEVNAALFVNHPYGRPIIGWSEEIKQLNREDATAFYRQWYAPNNAILVVSGDVSAEELRPLAERTYGAVAPVELPERVRPPEPEIRSVRRLVLADPEVRQPSLQIKMRAPTHRAGETEQAHPLEVLTDLLGGSSTSRLHRKLVVEQKIATSAWAAYSPGNYDETIFAIGGTPVDGVSLDELEAALDAELTDILTNGVTEEEVERAKQRMIADAAYARDSLFGPGYAFGIALTTGRTVEDVESWPERIGAVTVEQVNDAARALFGRPGRVIGHLLPAETDAAEAIAPTAGTPYGEDRS